MSQFLTNPVSFPFSVPSSLRLFEFLLYAINRQARELLVGQTTSMELPSAQFTSPAPAPLKSSSTKHTPVTYEDVVAAARRSVLQDFARQYAYRQRVRDVEALGVVDSIPTSSHDAALTKSSSSKWLKEHSSISWSLWFYQWSIFAGFAVMSVTTAMTAYLTATRNRVFFPFSLISASFAHHAWTLLEVAWEEKRYVDNAAQIRAKRVANPSAPIAREQSESKSTVEIELERDAS